MSKSAIVKDKNDDLVKTVMAGSAHVLRGDVADLTMMFLQLRNKAGEAKAHATAAEAVAIAS